MSAKKNYHVTKALVKNQDYVVNGRWMRLTPPKSSGSSWVGTANSKKIIQMTLDAEDNLVVKASRSETGIVRAIPYWSYRSEWSRFKRVQDLEINNGTSENTLPKK